jgi:hypothetical protein
MDLSILNGISDMVIPYSVELIKEGGKNGIGKLANVAFEKLLKKFSSTKPSELIEPLNELFQQPDNPEIQGVLKYNLRKALKNEPELATFLKEWLAEVAPLMNTQHTINQIASAGDYSSIVQISGSGNHVN